jgi:hypothetical protein
MLVFGEFLSRVLLLAWQDDYDDEFGMKRMAAVSFKIHRFIQGRSEAFHRKVPSCANRLPKEPGIPGPLDMNGSTSR